MVYDELVNIVAALAKRINELEESMVLISEVLGKVSRKVDALPAPRADLPKNHPAMLG